MNIARVARDNLSLILVVAIFLLILILARDYLFVGIFALSLAVILVPVHRKLSGKIPAWISAGFLTTLITGVIVSICAAIIIVLLSDIEYLIEVIRTVIDTVMEYAAPAAEAGIGTQIADAITNIIVTMFPNLIIGAAQLIPQLILDLVIFFALLYCFIIFGDRIWKDIWSVLPNNSRGNVGLMAKKTKDILYSLYIVHVFIAVLTYFLAYGFFLILGYGHVEFYAMLCAVFALIPFLGPLIVLVFVGVYAICIGDWKGLILICTIGYFLICVVTDIILRPKLTGRRVEIRPMLMFVGFFGGAMVMGVLGFILGPVLLVLGITGYEIFFRELRSRSDRNLEHEDTSCDQMGEQSNQNLEHEDTSCDQMGEQSNQNLEHEDTSCDQNLEEEQIP